MKAIRGKLPLTELETIKPFISWLNEAKGFERDNELDRALGEYKKIIQAYPLKEEGYDRLMIIHRKNKNIKDELAVIKKAIKTFEDRFGRSSENLKGTKVKRLSNAILKSMGLADKNGHAIYQHEPIGRWMRRKKTLESKLKNFPG